MKVLRLFPLLLLLTVFQVVGSDDATIVLQNGLNEYTGCEDSYIADWMTNNTGSDDTLYAELEECAS